MTRRLAPVGTEHRLVVVLGAIVVAALGLGAGSAYALWTTSGSGSGSGTTGSLAAVTVAATVGGDAPGSDLLPGGPAADVILRVSNPNAYAVSLVSVSGNGTISADGAHPGCTVTGVTFADQPGLSVTIGASGTTLVHLAGAAGMSAASSNGCQGATFSIPVSITVHR